MSRFKFACHLIQFAGEQKENPEKVFRELAEAGWDGVEGIDVSSSDEIIEMATLAGRFGLHLVNVAGPGSAIDAVRYNITPGNDAAGIPELWRSNWGGADATETELKLAAQTLDEVLDFCDRHNIKGFHHAHLGTMIETIEDAEQFLSAAPKLWFLFDTGHLLAAGSDPMQVFHRPILCNRIGHVHLKDFHADDPQSWNHRTQKFGEQGRFAELGAENVGLDVEVVLSALTEVGYGG